MINRRQLFLSLVAAPLALVGTKAHTAPEFPAPQTQDDLNAYIDRVTLEVTRGIQNADTRTFYRAIAQDLLHHGDAFILHQNEAKAFEWWTSRGKSVLHAPSMSLLLNYETGEVTGYELTRFENGLTRIGSRLRYRPEEITHLRWGSDPLKGDWYGQGLQPRAGLVHRQPLPPIEHTITEMRRILFGEVYPPIHFNCRCEIVLKQRI